MKTQIEQTSYGFVIHADFEITSQMKAAISKLLGIESIHNGQIYKYQLPVTVGKCFDATVIAAEVRYQLEELAPNPTKPNRNIRTQQQLEANLDNETV